MTVTKRLRLGPLQILLEPPSTGSGRVARGATRCDHIGLALAGANKMELATISSPASLWPTGSGVLRNYSRGVIN